ncbi:MAG: hypothetical protein J1F38_07295 [Muribaculaceae bacterium]|nr:hypothetical protein [Muribaculaceae bacterium]
MKKIKYLVLCLFGLSLGLTSCNKNNATPIYIPLPVIETFNPVMKEFYYSESQGLPIINENVYVVNSISELPDDDIFGNEEFMNQEIDFSQYSLIIFYNLQLGKILSTKFRWGYNNDLEKYQVSISYEVEKGSDIIDGEVELVNYVRGAMLVDHIPPQPFVSQRKGVHWVDPE